MKDQHDVERLSREEGQRKKQKSRSRNIDAKQASLNSPEMNLMTRTVVPLARAISAWLVDSSARYASLDAARGASRRSIPRDAAFRLIPLVSPEVAAYVTSRSAVDQAHLVPSATSVAIGVGGRIEREVAYERLRVEAPFVWRRLRGTGRLEATGSGRHMKKALEWGEIDHEAWTTRDKLRVGLQLLDLMVASTGLVELSQLPRKGRAKGRVLSVVFTSEAEEWLASAAMDDISATPWLLPMVEEPDDWTGFEEGGYKTIPYCLVKRASSDYVNTQKFPRGTARAVNALQRTPWVVNEDVLEVARIAWQQKHEVPGLPAGDEVPLPERSASWTKGDEMWVDWNRRAAKIHEMNRRGRSKRIAVIETLRVAEMFRNDMIYFPMQLDWRGRIYTMPSMLTPMGFDLQRALLTFGEHKAIETDAQMQWLKVHGANTWGNDKVSFAERCSWVDMNADTIRDVASDPLSNRQWWDADKPFAFLAWCLDYTEALRRGSSAIPVAMDGTCSGLQHYSAMLRDERGGAAVNLLPSNDPADIYTEVLSVVRDKLTTRAAASDSASRSLARQWLQSGYLTRKITKRPTMTTPYGVTPQGIYEQTIGTMREIAAADGGVMPFEDHNGIKPANMLSMVIREAIGEVVSASREGMEVLQDCARQVAAEGAHPEWTTPSGFHVVQSYPATASRQVKTLVSGRIIRPRLKEEVEGVDKRKHTMGIAPNVVHSLDATHLTMSVNAMVARSKAFVSFAMVHDSFGTHAADCPVFADTLREQFVELYQGDVLKDITEQLHGQAPLAKSWPAMPRYGSLNLEDVRESDFFFG